MTSEKGLPGTHIQQRPNGSVVANRYIQEWGKKRLELKKDKSRFRMSPTICLSRRIGVGVQEIADILAEKTGYRVIDRKIIEHIPYHSQLSEKTVAFFDGLYPDLIGEYLSLIAGEKGFSASDNAKHLFSAVLALASLEPTIFVGRGAHLILPRNRVLAVRFTCAIKYRIERLAGIYNLNPKAAKNKLDQLDKQQNDFFKIVFGKKKISPYDFDLVINCDFIREPQWAAEIVACALKEKFGAEGANGKPP